MLVPARELLQDAQKEKYAVAQFNVGCFEVFKAVVETAGELQAPIILGTSEKEMAYWGAPFIFKLAEEAAKKFGIPIALHLDHAQSLKTCLEALNAGYTSVHIDGSHLPFEENIALTLAVSKTAHGVGASCEGELGGIQGSSEIHLEPYEKIEEKIEYTDPEKVEKFIEDTNIDSLAVAVGTVHGIYKTPPKINFSLLEEISKRAKIPLVLHGGSGVEDKDIKKAIELGICKININTELRATYAAVLKKVLKEKKEEIKPYNIFPEVIDALKLIVRKKIELFKSNYRA